MPARSIKPIIDGVTAAVAPHVPDHELVMTVVTISALSPGVRPFVGMSFSPVLSILRVRMRVQIITNGRRVAPMQAAGHATLSAQEVKKPLTGRAAPLLIVDLDRLHHAQRLRRAPDLRRHLDVVAAAAPCSSGREMAD